MSFICPVCNGLTDIRYTCPICEQPLADEGRLSDFFDPYSAYRPIDELKLTNGVSDDAVLHQCLHALACARCGRSIVYPVQERQ